MKEGFYWIKSRNEPLQVWYYLSQLAGTGHKAPFR